MIRSHLHISRDLPFRKCHRHQEPDAKGIRPVTVQFEKHAVKITTIKSSHCIFIIRTETQCWVRQVIWWARASSSVRTFLKSSSESGQSSWSLQKRWSLTKYKFILTWDACEGSQKATRQSTDVTLWQASCRQRHLCLQRGDWQHWAPQQCGDTGRVWEPGKIYSTIYFWISLNIILFWSHRQNQNTSKSRLSRARTSLKIDQNAPGDGYWENLFHRVNMFKLKFSLLPKLQIDPQSFTPHMGPEQSGSFKVLKF